MGFVIDFKNEKLKNELLGVMLDCPVFESNIAFRVFLSANYEEDCLKENYPELYKYYGFGSIEVDDVI